MGDQKFLQSCEVERRMATQTVTAYRSDFLQLIEFLRQQSRWGLVKDDTLATFTLATVREFQYYMAEQGWSTATVRRHLISLNRFGVWLVKRRFVIEHPLAGMEFPRKTRRLPRLLAWTELKAAIAHEPHVRNRAILSLLTYAGVRRGEVVGLDLRDYSRTARSVHVRGKGNKDRVIGLPENLHPHMFRHSYATELLERDADLRVIRDLLGHESVATTEIYTHISAARQRGVVQLLEK
jgi:integrase/recombinase XerC